MTLTNDEARRAIRPLLSPKLPADAMAHYYAYRHPAAKTRLFVEPEVPGRKALGYVALSRTGVDLFRPLVTWRLPAEEPAVLRLLNRALPEGFAAVLSVPERDAPLVRALFDVGREEIMHVFVWPKGKPLSPIVNVFLHRERTPDQQVHFTVRRTDEQGHAIVVASAYANWVSEYFVDVSVHTRQGHRRQGYARVVLSAFVRESLKFGRRPLYTVSQHNAESLALARDLGFEESGQRLLFADVVRRPLLK